jgi:WD40 repeat protein
VLFRSPDGRRAVSASSDGTLKLWDLDTGQCLRTLQGHIGGRGDVALSPDGRRVTSGTGDETVRVWDLDTGRCLAAWVARREVRFCATSPHAIVASTHGGEVLFLRLVPAGRVAPIPMSATWNPSRPLLAVRRENGSVLVHAWHPDAQDLEEVARTASTTWPIACIAWSADGAYVVALSTYGKSRTLDAVTLRDVSGSDPLSVCLPRDVSADGRWRAVIRDGRFEIVSTDASPPTGSKP